MAPIPAHPTPTLVEFMNKSPALFWVLATALTVTFLCLASWAFTKVHRYYKPKAVEWFERLNDPYAIDHRKVNSRFSYVQNEHTQISGFRVCLHLL